MDEPKPAALQALQATPLVLARPMREVNPTASDGSEDQLYLFQRQRFFPRGESEAHRLKRPPTARPRMTGSCGRSDHGKMPRRPALHVGILSRACLLSCVLSLGRCRNAETPLADNRLGKDWVSLGRVLLTLLLTVYSSDPGEEAAPRTAIVCEPWHPAPTSASLLWTAIYVSGFRNRSNHEP